MLRLLYGPLSPFARKARVAAYETGLADQIRFVEIDVWSSNPDPDVQSDAPLGQIPVLLGGPVPLPGSTLICEYLDSLSRGARLIPAASDEKWLVMGRHALADGMITAGVSHTVERHRRPKDVFWPQWLVRQKGKIERSLTKFEAMPHDDDVVDLATITLSCALSYLDRRLPEMNWRDRHPALTRWHAVFEQRPSMQATRFPVEEKAV